jgi:Caspase domain
VIFGAADPAFGVLDATGQRRLFQEPASADFRDNRDGFRLARDGATVQFSYEPWGTSPARFALRDRSLTLAPAADQALAAPVTTASGLHITDWKSTMRPTLNGTALKLDLYETSISLAIAPDSQRFLLGTAWHLRLFNRQGAEQWHVPVPGIAAWSVNIAGNGEVAAAALGDGTIRWYRLRDGQELLALFPHRDRKRWVLWTPSGYYDASPGAEELLGWHVNRGRDAAADFFPVSQFRSTYFRPDVVAAVLDILDEDAALQQANAAMQRQQPPVPLTQRLPPVVQIRAPQDGATVSTPTVTVRFTLRTPSDEPVTALKALVDGRPAAQPRRVRLTAPEETLQELEVSVPQRDCEVSVIAENRYAASEPATVRLRWGGAPAEEVPKPRLYVLAVGVSRYQDSRLILSFAAKDASDVAAVLQRQKGRLYRDVEVKLVTDATATKGEMLDALEWLEHQTTSKDVAVLFLAGHGINDRNGDYYFLPVDVDTERLKRTGIAFSDITRTVTGLPGKVVVFLDTCHAGNIMGQRRGAMDITGVINELTSAQNGAVVFAASTGHQYSLENPAWGNGAFSKAVIEGLNGKADERRTGRITVTMLDLYVAERVKELTKGQQTPTTTKPHSVPDFPVALTP